MGSNRTFSRHLDQNPFKMSSGLHYCWFCSFQNPRKWIKYYISCTIQTKKKKSLLLSLWHVLKEKFMSVSLSPCRILRLSRVTGSWRWEWEGMTSTGNKLHISLCNKSKERISEGRWCICPKNKNHSGRSTWTSKPWNHIKGWGNWETLKATGKESKFKCWEHVKSPKSICLLSGHFWPKAPHIAHVLDPEGVSPSKTF